MVLLSSENATIKLESWLLSVKPSIPVSIGLFNCTTADTTAVLSTSLMITSEFMLIASLPSRNVVVKFPPATGPLRSTIGGLLTRVKLTKAVAAMLFCKPSLTTNSTILRPPVGFAKSLIYSMLLSKFEYTLTLATPVMVI